MPLYLMETATIWLIFSWLSQHLFIFPGWPVGVGWLSYLCPSSFAEIETWSSLWKVSNVEICVRLLKTELHRIEKLTECETDIFMHFLVSLDEMDDFFIIYNRKKVKIWETIAMTQSSKVTGGICVKYPCQANHASLP